MTYLKVDKTGRVNPGDLPKAITDQTCLVTIMLANNETGSVQPIKELAKIAKERNILFHTDAVQAVGKIPVDVEELGVGALFIRKDVNLESLIHGGGHEGGIRSGTENTLGIAGLGKAMEMVPKYLGQMSRIKKLRDRLEEGIKNIVSDCQLNGHRNYRLPNTLNVTLSGLRGESIVLEMDKKGCLFFTWIGLSFRLFRTFPCLISYGTYKRERPLYLTVLIRI